ncbi:MAG: ABC transporter substrate-binding protein, partial [Hyphomicrobiaceae bacterium]|nr:ABC transporter substrate-binding protein [Hyphomicrobiaceae bacterium]
MRHVFKHAFAATAAAAFLATSALADEPKRGGTLVTVIASTPRVLNPAVQSGVATGFPGAQLFASPLRYDDSWTPQPYLAKSWEVSDDGLKVTLHLVENATFHDGHPITSEDVAFSVDIIKQYHPFKSMFAPVTSVDTPDPHTAVINLSKPHPALMLAMSGQLMSIIPKHIYGDGQDPKNHPRNNVDVVGSGPFKL